MRTEEMSLATIFNMEAVSAICCPQLNNLSGGVGSRHASNGGGSRALDTVKGCRIRHPDIGGSSAPPAQNTCPTCGGQGTVDYPGTTDGTQMDCTNPNCRDFEWEE